jgi:hypothetical protein
MTKKNLLLIFMIFLGTILVCPTPSWASSDAYFLSFLMIFAGVSTLAYFCATVMVMFGLSYTTAFLSAFGILLLSFFVGDYFSRNIMEKLPRPAESAVPADSTDNSIREMNLS